MLTILTGILVLSTVAYGIYTLMITRGLLFPLPGSTRSDNPSVAVVIAARNEEANLPDLLSDLVAQNYSGQLDIYVGNDRSTDSTHSILETFASKYAQIHPVHINQTSDQMTPKKNALTACMRKTTAEIILSTDADCRVGEKWVSSAVSHLTEDTGILVGYSQVQGSGFFQKYQALDFIGIMVANAGIMARGPAWSGSGQNLAYRRSAFTDIGGFHDVATKVSGDDVFLVQTIPARTGLKAKFNFDTDHFVKTMPLESVGAFLNQRIRWSSNSKGLEQSDSLFFGFLLSAFLTNFTMLLTIVLGLWSPWLLICIAVKFLYESLVILAGSRRFGYGSLLHMFPIWFLIQPVYISYVGLLGLRGKFSWKV